MQLCRAKGPDGTPIFEAGRWRTRGGDVMLYRPEKPGIYPRIGPQTQRESYWQLLPLTQRGYHLLSRLNLRGQRFSSLRQAKWALEGAQAYQEAEPPGSALSLILQPGREI